MPEWGLPAGGLGLGARQAHGVAGLEPQATRLEPALWHAPWIVPRVPSRVLVAGDQTDIQQALRLLLSEAGFDTDLVGSVDGVMDRLSGGEYDLLLMDLNYTRDTTSGREGLELIDRIRAPRRKAAPFVSAAQHRPAERWGGSVLNISVIATTEAA